jgi:hypothetical protein
MNHDVYTLGAWRVKEGRQQEFIATWKELGTVFAGLQRAPAGKGILVQSISDPALFYSFGPWRSLEDIAAMRADERAKTGIARLRDLCTEAVPGSFRVVAESSPCD